MVPQYSNDSPHPISLLCYSWCRHCPTSGPLVTHGCLAWPTPMLNQRDKELLFSCSFYRVLSFTQLEYHRSLAWPWNNCQGPGQSQVQIGLDLHAHPWTGPDFKGDGIVRTDFRVRMLLTPCRFYACCWWEMGGTGAEQTAVISISSWSTLAT